MSDIEDIYSAIDLNEIEEVFTSKPTWFNICNVIKHEMYPKLASAIMAITEDEFKSEAIDHNIYSISIPLYSIKENIEEVIQYLKTKRKLAIEERNYLRMFIQRALQFVPITINSTS